MQMSQMFHMYMFLYKMCKWLNFYAINTACMLRVYLKWLKVPQYL